VNTPTIVMGKGEAIPSHDIKVLGGMFNDLTLGDTPNIMGKGASHPMKLRSWWQVQRFCTKFVFNRYILVTITTNV
jgi:hypothetical protein